MAELILHHSLASPFAEKVRLMLGFKGLAWRSVLVPEMMPMPDVLALTGGYGRTPILQIGADIYCDTALITTELETIKPKPSLFAGNALAHHAIVYWAETALRDVAASLAYQGPGLSVLFPKWGTDEHQRFRDEHAAARMGGVTSYAPIGECSANLLWFRNFLEAQLGTTRPFLLGEHACTADFAVYHPLWLLRRVAHVLPGAFPFGENSPVRPWMDRMNAFGQGKPLVMSGAEAIGIARTSKFRPIVGAAAVSTDGPKLHDLVAVPPADNEREFARGRLMNADPRTISIQRADPRAGNVMMHFPRFGYELTAAA